MCQLPSSVLISHPSQLERPCSRAHSCSFLLFFVTFSSFIHFPVSYSISGPTNSPTVGGVVVTVIGPIVQPISIIIGATSCASLVIVSFEAVACTVSTGTGAALDIKAYAHTIPSYFSYDVPQVSKCSVVSAAGGRLHVTGSNFGTNALTGNRTLGAKVSGMSVASQWLSDSSLVMMAPAGAGRTMDFTVPPQTPFLHVSHLFSL
jgi:hypothetical protein